MKVLLLAGGWSPEREVSLKGGEQIAVALKERGHSVTLCDPAKDFERLMDMAREHDAAFINLHGAPGEDGLVQAILDRVNCQMCIRDRLAVVDNTLSPQANASSTALEQAS